MRRRGTIIPPRIPIFLGCEGESEQAYGQFLNTIVRESNLPFHIEVVNLNPGAGDPVARIKRAEQEVKRRSNRRAEFRFKTILMDSDQIENDHQRPQQVETLAASCGISIVWQQPCHEAFLLRHFEGYHNHRPATPTLALTALLEVWPDYKKPMTSLQVSRKISMAGVHRAATDDAALKTFLRRIRLIV
ncbi:RloB domain-containing protein [Mesorhizobium sp. B283B1A]|uniref:RloB domain-containing protein n=1 Tax=Mesorhizobium TaxID=68287 RepID=UPI001CD0B5CE|nr:MULTISPECIES: RloB domain-containing protein [Mesorhizobium]MCA0050604.1 RloB domain-containing protein [Mesorhizobium sp. B283B1A]UQS65286.1 RloB domain-containing protein [Mesorhizobium opportunistum]